MSRIAYVNGRYIPLNSNAVPLEDRGLQFADGVYEVVAVRRKKLVEMAPHLARLNRSLKELAVASPITPSAYKVIFDQLIRRNHIRDGLIYIQITRGTAPRDHGFPSKAYPNLFVTCKHIRFDQVIQRARKGVSAVTVRDIRWGRCDIKSTSLLPNVLAKQKARESGAFEAILFDEHSFITEGTSTNVWMVIKNQELVTRSIDDNILAGITRKTIKSFAEQSGLKISERSFSVEEAYGAAELFLTSATSCATPVTKLNDTVIGDGKPGPIALELLERYVTFMDNQE